MWSTQYIFTQVYYYLANQTHTSFQKINLTFKSKKFFLLFLVLFVIHPNSFKIMQLFSVNTSVSTTIGEQITQLFIVDESILQF